MKREDKWGEDTSRSRKMGGVYLSEGKNGGSNLYQLIQNDQKLWKMIIFFI